MTKRGFVVIAIALLVFLIPGVLAQQFFEILTFREAIGTMVESGFFTFIFFFGLFFVAAIASLSRVFSRNHATLIGLFLSLILTTSGTYYGYLNLEMFGPWALAFFFLILILSLLFFFVMGKERKPPTLKIILLAVFVIGVISLIFIPTENLIWNYVFWFSLLAGVLGLLLLAVNLGGLRWPQGRRREEEERVREGEEEEGGRRREEEEEREIVGGLSVRIVEPADGKEFRVGDRVPFKAEIQGGNAPYTSNIVIGKDMRYFGIRSHEIVFIPDGIPTIGLPSGPTPVEIDTTDSSGKRVWYKAWLKRARGQHVSASVRINLLEAPKELKVDITRPRGEIDGKEKLTLIGVIQGGQLPYYATRISVDGNPPIPGAEFHIPGAGAFSYEFGRTPLELGMEEGSTHVIELEVVDRNGTQAIGNTEVTVKGGEPRELLSVKFLLPQAPPLPPQTFKAKEVKSIPYKIIITGGEEPYAYFLLLDNEEIYSEENLTPKEGKVEKGYSIPVDDIRDILESRREHVFLVRAVDHKKGEVEATVKFFYETEETPPPPPGVLGIKFMEPQQREWKEDLRSIPFKVEISGAEPPYDVYLGIDGLGIGAYAPDKGTVDGPPIQMDFLSRILAGKFIGKHALSVRVEKEGYEFAEDSREIEITSATTPTEELQVKMISPVSDVRLKDPFIIKAEVSGGKEPYVATFLVNGKDIQKVREDVPRPGEFGHDFKERYEAMGTSVSVGLEFSVGVRIKDSNGVEKIAENQLKIVGENTLPPPEDADIDKIIKGLKKINFPKPDLSPPSFAHNFIHAPSKLKIGKYSKLGEISDLIDKANDIMKKYPEFDGQRKDIGRMITQIEKDLNRFLNYEKKRELVLGYVDLIRVKTGLGIKTVLRNPQRVGKLIEKWGNTEEKSVMKTSLRRLWIYFEGLQGSMLRLYETFEIAKKLAIDSLKKIKAISR